MATRASELIAKLGLQPHPEGGHYREIYRSSVLVSPLDGRTNRAALTTIYFLLSAGEVSRWHRVASDEVWHYYEGDALELHVATPTFEKAETATLGPVAHGHEPVHIVPAGSWQAARTTGAYTLVGCTVAPGFDFADFVLVDDDPEALARASGSQHPAITRFLNPNPRSPIPDP